MGWRVGALVQKLPLSSRPGFRGQAIRACRGQPAKGVAGLLALMSMGMRQ